MLKNYTTVVVGTDGFELTVPTATRAAWVATEKDADLVIVCVYGGSSRRANAKVSLTETAPSRIGQVPGKEAATLAVTRARDIAVAAGARAGATLPVEADPAEALLSGSKQHLEDFIVIDAIRGRSTAGHLLGDVVNVVVRRARCDVLVIRSVNPDENEQTRLGSDAWQVARQVVNKTEGLFRWPLHNAVPATGSVPAAHAEPGDHDDEIGEEADPQPRPAEQQNQGIQDARPIA